MLFRSKSADVVVNTRKLRNIKSVPASETEANRADKRNQHCERVDQERRRNKDENTKLRRWFHSVVPILVGTERSNLLSLNLLLGLIECLLRRLHAIKHLRDSGVEGIGHLEVIARVRWGNDGCAGSQQIDH